MRNNSLHSRLSGLGSQLFGTKKSNQAEETANKQFPSRYAKLAKTLSGHIVQRAAGTFCQVDAVYPNNYAHGSFALRELLASPEIPVSSFTKDATEGTVTLEQLRFIDTETTGLGGSGTVPFLIGVAKIENGSVQMRQFFLPDYNDEAGMLEAFCEELPDDCSLVSYNGLSFDQPALLSRCIVNRIATNLDTLPHYDLLFPMRRLFKRRLKDCKLQNIEKQILGFERVDDIPGFLIPSCYFDWLSEEKTDLLNPIVEHNRLDILSLVFLAGFLRDIFAEEGEPLEEIDDIHSLSRTYAVRKAHDITYRLFQRMESLSADSLSEDVLLYHAANLRRMGKLTEAVELWMQIADIGSKPGALAAIELAKYHERYEGNFETALQFAKQASRSPLLTKTHKTALDNRIARLHLKIRTNSDQ